ncbi:ScbA/BarX family gamma-butyrolactone biosynthesis protein [Streptomyces misionensis]|uniref:ScbA/BarX family gamma-butyrolactone biosynthesis protein n=1 Tax=Streptomyces misionensis TaxID=67331 RepID=UPI00339E1B30
MMRQRTSATASPSTAPSAFSAGVVASTQALHYAQAIPRTLVHRASVAEVFLTDAAADGPDRLLVAAQWPRDHALYHPDADGTSDPLLFAESIRQTLLYVGHGRLGIPLGHRFVGQNTGFRIWDREPLRVKGAPVPVVLETTWDYDGSRAPKRYDVRLETALSVDGVRCGHGHIEACVVDERRYQLLRRRVERPASGPSGQPGAPRLAPHRVGRLRAKDCVLAPGGDPDEWWLRLDLNHAILFDHPTDHIPQAVMLEGFRQLGHLYVHERGQGAPGDTLYGLVGARVDCLAFGELDIPTRLSVTRAESANDGTRELVISAVQGERRIAEAVLNWAPAPVAARAAEPVLQLV